MSAIIPTDAMFVGVAFPDEDDPKYGVWIGSKHIHSFATVAEADSVCIQLATYHRCRAMPLGPAIARGERPPTVTP